MCAWLGDPRSLQFASHQRLAKACASVERDSLPCSRYRLNSSVFAQSVVDDGVVDLQSPEGDAIYDMQLKSNYMLGLGKTT